MISDEGVEGAREDSSDDDILRTGNVADDLLEDSADGTDDMDGL